MKKHPIALVCVAVLLATLVAPVYASVSVQSTIGDNIYVVYNLENLDQVIYNEAKVNQQLFNSSTIPQIIAKNLERQELTRVDYSTQPNTYEDSTRTIRVSFYLGGSDIISYELNRTTMSRTYEVKTDWRKFQVNLTSNFSINFAQHFAEPVQKWEKPNPTTLLFEAHDTGFLDVLSFHIVLPAAAIKVQTLEDTITYEIPPYFEDVFLNSPFLILAALIVIIMIVLIYRRVR